jgi:uncharacterized DUF497 family protein
MRFELDDKKNEINIKKHGISFEEAKAVFDDPLHLAILDKRYNYFEERWITVGKIPKDKIVVAAHIYFDNDGEEVIRIISARIASSSERKQYES